MMASEAQSLTLDALALIAAVYQGNEQDANAMLATYTEPAELADLFQAVLAHMACLLRLFGNSTGHDPAKLLAVVGSNIRNGTPA